MERNWVSGDLAAAVAAAAAVVQVAADSLVRGDYVALAVLRFAFASTRHCCIYYCSFIKLNEFF